MSALRDRIEAGFESWAEFLIQRRWVVLAIAVLMTAVMSAGLSKLTIDFSNEGFLRESDPTVKRYEAFKAQFGREDAIAIAVRAPDLFSADTLTRLRDLHEALSSSVPHVNEITSLVNARNTRGEGDRLIVEDLMARPPRTPAARESLRARVRANPLYRNQVISADGHTTLILVELNAFSAAGTASSADAALAGFDDARPNRAVRKPLTEAENKEAVEAALDVVERFNREDFRLYVAGTPYLLETMKAAMRSDMETFVVLANLIIAVCLLVLFRRLAGLLMPLCVVLVAMITTLGLMGHFGIPIKVTTVIVPAFLVCVGVGSSVHIMSNFFLRLGEDARPRDAIVHAMGHSGLPVVMACLTTAVGLGSFAAAEVPPVAELGQVSSMGVLLSLAYTIVLLPVLLAIFPIKPHRHGTAIRAPIIDRALDRVTDLATGYPRSILAASLVLIVVFLGFATQLRFTHDPISWLPRDWPIRQATDVVNRDLGGAMVLEIVVDSGRPNGLYDRDLLVGMARLAKSLEAMQDGPVPVGKATSLADMVAEIHQALNGNRREMRKIPDDPKLIPQEILLFENSGSDDLKKVVDSQFQIARFSIRLPWQDVLSYLPLLEEVERRFRTQLGPGVTVTTTGLISIFSRTMTAAIHSAAESYIIAFGLITLMMILLIGEVRLGLASMLPNLTPIVIAIGLMWATGIPVNLSTMLVGSVAVGLAVDDTIHFMHNFRRYFARTGDAVLAVRQTLHTAGRAMLVTSIVLGTGFYSEMFASMSTTADFGFLTGTAIVLALLADFLLAPALMVLMNRRPTRESAPVPVMEGQG